MRSRILVTATDLHDFKQRYEACAPHSVGIDYLARSRVRAFYRDGEMVGGYVVNLSLPLRYVDWVPIGLDRDSFEKCIDYGRDLAEICCIWMTVGKFLPRDRFWLYGRCIADALLTFRRSFIGGSTSAAVSRIQRRVLSRILYSGPFAGSPSTQCDIYAATRLELLRNMVDVLLKRLLPRRFSISGQS